MNDMTIGQISTVLNSIVQQATGKNAIAVTNTSDFVSVAQTALKVGYDPLINAISQVLSRTIFSVRPYTRKFKGLEASSIAYGNHVRKINYGDTDWTDDDRYNIYDADAKIDQQEPAKPAILQTNFYGQNTFQREYTIWKDQVDSAFSSPDEFAGFISGVTQNCSDMIEQAHENLARATLANLIGGIVSEADGNRIVHLLTEYNTATGLNLTATTVYQPENYSAFMRWVFARIAAVSSMLTERSQLYHTNVTATPISRHTPESDQRVFMYAPNRFGVEARVLADTYHDNYLRMAVNETVNFWQSIATPDTINVTPTYLTADGSLTTPSEAVNQANIFGLIMDREAAGYTTVNQWSGTSPFNQRGGYQNVWFHFTDRYWNDFTENAVLFLLD